MARECFGTLGCPPLPGLHFAPVFLLYLDASGTADPKDVATEHYVLTGLRVHERSWFGLEKRLSALKRKYQFPGTDFELHVTQFAVSIKEQDEIPGFEDLSWQDRRLRVLDVRRAKLDAETDKKKRQAKLSRFRATEPFIHLSRRDRSQLLEDAVELVASHDSIGLFAEAVSKSHPQVTSGAVEPVAQAFELVVSRFDTFLQKKSRWKAQVSARPSIDHGLLILDRDAATEATLEKLFRDFRHRGHSFGQLTHVIDVPFFASSEKVSGLQLVDDCAYVVRRYLDTRARPGSHEARQFQRLFPKFGRDSFGKLHGARHYVPYDTCRCMICEARGHLTKPDDAADSAE